MTRPTDRCFDSKTGMASQPRLFLDQERLLKIKEEHQNENPHARGRNADAEQGSVSHTLLLDYQNHVHHGRRDRC